MRSLHTKAPLFSVIILLLPLVLIAKSILIPMDMIQTDHLRAYGIAYGVLEHGVDVEWLLNYKGGAFLFNDFKEARDLCLLRGVRFEVLSSSDVVTVYETIEANNMEKIILEKPPKIAVYTPSNKEPWDDAVTLALVYAKIPYEKVWDEEVLHGELSKYDWLHLHHEDFTGQYGKFYGSFRNADWYREEVNINTRIAEKLGFQKVWYLKHAVARAIKHYIAKGGFIFSMCSAPITLDIALAAEGVDIVDAALDGDPVEQLYSSKLNFSNTLAFENFNLITNPMTYEHSDVDVTNEAQQRGQSTYFSLFEFSAKYDPVPSMLTQNHTALVKEFLGQDCGFRREKVKKSVVILGYVSGTEEIKYLHGNYGEGTFTFLGGHDPEDYAHYVGEPPTRLEQHKSSPGYRLILNNVLFPAAKKKKLKT
ncbi:MAG: asparagine synthetase B [Candidatus Cloacimonadota bacterium]|nr:MAG: asparagine synthetase B [Candidatus Cloacimonadota bacterium]